MFPVDKLQICRDALQLTGNNASVVADDGSDEWDKASTAYEMGLPYAIENGNWSFATQVATMIPTGVAPSDSQYDTTVLKPSDSLHLIWVKAADAPINYEIIDNKIVLLARGSSPITIKYVRQPTPDQLSPNFVAALRAFTMSGIYRGLNEDTDSADKQWRLGEAFLQQARTRSDQEQPKRAVFSSRSAMSRRVGRPWPRNPGGWGQAGT